MDRTTDGTVPAGRAIGVVVGDLADASEVRSIASQANGCGAFDAVIHNAGIYVDTERVATDDGHARVLAVNVLAPYMLTALIERPARLIYLSSGMHHDGDPSLDDIEWIKRPWNGVQAYCDSKLFLTTVAAAIARRWPDVHSNAVDPGWVPTRMGGAGAPDDLVQGYLTQVWLAVSNDPEANMTGGYWHHMQTETPASVVNDQTFHEAVLNELGRLTGLPCSDSDPCSTTRRKGPRPRWSNYCDPAGWDGITTQSDARQTVAPWPPWIDLVRVSVAARPGSTAPHRVDAALVSTRSVERSYDVPIVN